MDEEQKVIDDEQKARQLYAQCHAIIVVDKFLHQRKHMDEVVKQYNELMPEGWSLELSKDGTDLQLYH